MTELSKLKKHLKAVDHIPAEDVEFRKIIDMEDRLLKDEIQLIKNLILGYTGNTGNIFLLSGPRNKEKRQQIQSIIMDKKVAISKSGIHEIEKSLLEIAEIKGTCCADEEKRLTQWIKGE